MCPADVVIIIDVFIQHTIQMSFTEKDHMVKALPARVPITLSQIGFCQGERKAVGLSFRPNRLIVRLKSSLKILSLSLMTYLVVSSKAKVSLSC